MGKTRLVCVLLLAVWCIPATAGTPGPPPSAKHRHQHWCGERHKDGEHRDGERHERKDHERGRQGGSG